MFYEIQLHGTSSRSQNERNAKIRHTERNRSIPDLLSSQQDLPGRDHLPAGNAGRTRFGRGLV